MHYSDIVHQHTFIVEISSRMAFSRCFCWANMVVGSSSNDSLEASSGERRISSADGLSRGFKRSIWAITLWRGSEYFWDMGEYLPSEMASFKDGKLSPRKGGRNDATLQRKSRREKQVCRREKYNRSTSYIMQPSDQISDLKSYGLLAHISGDLNKRDKIITDIINWS